MSTYLGQRRISFQSALMLWTIIVFGYLSFLILFRNDQAFRAILNDFLFPVFNGLTVLSLFYAAKYSKPYGRRLQFAWTFMALGQLSFMLGDIVWAFLNYGGHQNPFPSAADGLYLMYYPLFATGIFLLPALPLTSGDRFKLSLDTGIIMLSAILFFWAFLIEPAIAANEENPLALAISLAYPVMDLALLFALLAFLFRPLQLARQGPLLLLSVGVAIEILTDSIYGLQALLETFASGELLSLGWLMSYAFVGLAAVMQAESSKIDPFRPFYEFEFQSEKLAWLSYLPYFCAFAAYLVLVWSRYQSAEISPSIVWGVGGVIGLVTIRQVTAINENERLFATAQMEIDERMLAEEALRETRDYLENLINSANAPIIVWDPSFRITRLNQAFERMTGREAAQVVSTSLDILFPEDSRTRSLEHISRTLSGERWEAVEIPILRTDGSIRIVLWNSANLYDKDGTTILATIAQGQDITERKQAEIVLKESERRLADIIDFLPDATFVIDREGKVIAWNRAIEAITGVNARDILGKGNYEYALPFYGERRPTLINLVLQHQKEIEEKYTHIQRRQGTLEGEAYISNLKGGDVYLYGKAAVLYDSEGNVFGAIESIRDITDRKQAEEKLQSAIENAEASTKAKSEFLANMSHEIRTPMNAVIGMTGLLLDTDLTQEQRDYSETIRNSGTALLALINDILDFSKIDRGKLELESQPFDLRSSVEDSLDMVAAKAASKGLELLYILEDDTPKTIIGDATRLRQILVNLLDNALKFTEKGEVVLSISSAPAEDGKFELKFAVSDTGIGISQDRMDRLFKSFSQVDSSTTRHYGGTGLGLAISKRLVELMGGRIWVQSKPGKGSTFHFTIAAKSPRSIEPNQPDPGLAGKRVLVVYGNALARNMILKAAESWRMIPAEAASGRDALEMLAKETFDFVIIDAVLPDMDGRILSTEIKKASDENALSVIFTPVGQSLLQDTLVDGWLTKPVKPLQLRNMLAELLLPENDLKTDASRAQLPASEMRQRSLRILMAEDNPVNQKVAQSMLGRIGYKADVAANGVEVLRALEVKSYDVVLMDVQMPEMDGLEATRLIRSSGSDIPIIAMTAHALNGDREICLSAGMDEYISKPIRMDELQKVLDKYEDAVEAAKS